MATKKAKTPKKRNPQDATRRNVQASNKRIEALEARMQTIEEGFREAWAVGQRVHNLEQRLEAIDSTSAAQPNSQVERIKAIEDRLDILAAGRPAPPQ